MSTVMRATVFSNSVMGSNLIMLLVNVLRFKSCQAKLGKVTHASCTTSACAYSQAFELGNIFESSQEQGLKFVVVQATVDGIQVNEPGNVLMKRERKTDLYSHCTITDDFLVQITVLTLFPGMQGP